MTQCFHCCYPFTLNSGKNSRPSDLLQGFDLLLLRSLVASRDPSDWFQAGCCGRKSAVQKPNPKNDWPYDESVWKPLVSLNKAKYETLISEGSTLRGIGWPVIYQGLHVFALEKNLRISSPNVLQLKKKSQCHNPTNSQLTQILGCSHPKQFQKNPLNIKSHSLRSCQKKSVTHNGFRG